MMIKRELELAFAAAVREAQQRRHEMLTVEHILYALLYDEMGSRILVNCGGDIDQLKRSLDEFFTENIELLPEAAEKPPESRQTGAAIPRFCRNILAASG